MFHLAQELKKGRELQRLAKDSISCAQEKVKRLQSELFVAKDELSVAKDKVKNLRQEISEANEERQQLVSLLNGKAAEVEELVENAMKVPMAAEEMEEEVVVIEEMAVVEEEARPAKKRRTILSVEEVDELFKKGSDELFKKGSEYFYGLNHEVQDESKGETIIMEAAEAGSELGKAYCLHFGWGDDPKDTEMAFRNFVNLATQRKDPHAMFLIGACYIHGDGVGKKRKEAIKWYQKAAELSSQALCNLGVLTADKKIAFDMFLKAANKGCMDARHHLALCYDTGRGVAQDKEKAMQWYHAAAIQGHPACKLTH